MLFGNWSFKVLTKDVPFLFVGGLPREYPLAKKSLSILEPTTQPSAENQKKTPSQLQDLWPKSKAQ